MLNFQKLKKSKRLIVLLAIIIGTVGIFGVNSSYKKELMALKKENLETKNKVMEIENTTNDALMEIENLKKADSSHKTSGANRVNASLLNIRTDGSSQNEPIGTVTMNSIVNVVDTSNPLWFKINLDLGQYNSSAKENTTDFYDKNTNKHVFEIENKYLNEGQLALGSEYYVSSLYLSEPSAAEYAYLERQAEPQNPFVYGVLFYNEEIAKILENEIWKSLGDSLVAKGYDGIKAVPYSRDDFQESVKNGYFDAVESSPGDYASANKDYFTGKDSSPKLEVFGKTLNKVNNQSSYAGIIITNKKSGITDLEDIKGETVLTCKPNSESGYVYQKYYMESTYGIDIEKETTLDSDNYHQDVLLRVARGDANVGFCGDFVTTDPYDRFTRNAEELNMILESDEQLKRYKDEIVVHYLDGISKIPNNPHSIKAELASDKEFVDALEAAVKYSYDNFREDFGLIDAYTEEYKFLTEFEEGVAGEADKENWFKRLIGSIF